MTLYGPPTAREHLGASMQNSIEWKERQMVNDYADPGPDIVAPRTYGWLIWPALVVGVIVFFAICSI